MDMLMKQKEYLTRPRLLRRQLEMKQNALELLRTRADGGGARQLTGLPRSATPEVHRMDLMLDRLRALEKEVLGLQDSLLSLQAEISEVISTVPDARCRLLLELRYVCFRSWEEIAEVMGYCEMYVYKLHRKALQQVRVPEAAEDSADLNAEEK